MSHWRLIGGALLLVLFLLLAVFSISGGRLSRLDGGVLCLSETQTAAYEILDNNRPGRVQISVLEADGEVVQSTEIEHPIPNSVKSHHLGRCGFYIHRSINYDFERKERLPGYSFEIWKYSYFSNQAQNIGAGR